MDLIPNHSPTRNVILMLLVKTWIWTASLILSITLFVILIFTRKWTFTGWAKCKYWKLLEVPRTPRMYVQKAITYLQVLSVGRVFCTPPITKLSELLRAGGFVVWRRGHVITREFTLHPVLPNIKPNMTTWNVRSFKH